MARNIEGREYLLIPNAAELMDASDQYRNLVTRRAERGQFIEVEGEQPRVSGHVNADQVLSDYPHLDETITALGVGVAKNLEAGRLSADEVFKLGAKYLLEMFSIATTAQESKQIIDGL